VLYPLEPYPVIREFAAILSELKPGKLWNGREFFGYTRRQRRSTSAAGTTGSPLRFRHKSGAASKSL
jgi:hypothetical protein